MAYTIREQVGAIICTGEETFLILQRNPARYEGWGFVKGGCEENENYTSAILREVEEETGIVFDSTRMQLTDLSYITAHYHHTHHYVAVVHWFLIQLSHDYDVAPTLDLSEWITSSFVRREEIHARLRWQTEHDVFNKALEAQNIRRCC
jgi:8-oxo-dGTP pyrophosphatase MutT (NUDIX family)